MLHETRDDETRVESAEFVSAAPTVSRPAILSRFDATLSRIVRGGGRKCLIGW